MPAATKELSQQLSLAGPQSESPGPPAAQLGAVSEVPELALAPDEPDEEPLPPEEPVEEPLPPLPGALPLLPHPTTRSHNVALQSLTAPLLAIGDHTTTDDERRVEQEAGKTGDLAMARTLSSARASKCIDWVQACWSPPTNGAWPIKH